MRAPRWRCLKAGRSRTLAAKNLYRSLTSRRTSWRGENYRLSQEGLELLWIHDIKEVPSQCLRGGFVASTGVNDRGTTACTILSMPARWLCSLDLRTGSRPGGHWRLSMPARWLCSLDHDNCNYHQGHPLLSMPARWLCSLDSRGSRPRKRLSMPARWLGNLDVLWGSPRKDGLSMPTRWLGSLDVLWGSPRKDGLSMPARWPGNLDDCLCSRLRGFHGSQCLRGGLVTSTQLPWVGSFNACEVAW